MQSESRISHTQRQLHKFDQIANVGRLRTYHAITSREVGRDDEAHSEEVEMSAIERERCTSYLEHMRAFGVIL